MFYEIFIESLMKVQRGLNVLQSGNGFKKLGELLNYSQLEFDLIMCYILKVLRKLITLTVLTRQTVFKKTILHKNEIFRWST